MRVLDVAVSGLPRFKGQLHINFYAAQRVAAGYEENLYQIRPKVYLNCINGFIGVNASGKTSVLEVLDFAFHLVNNEPLNKIPSRSILEGAKKAVFDIVFLTEQKQVVRLLTTITTRKDEASGKTKYIIADEKLFTKTVGSVKYKKQITDFDDCPNVVERESNDNSLFIDGPYDDISIVNALNKKNNEYLSFTTLIGLGAGNAVRDLKNIAPELVQFLDPGIEALQFGTDGRGAIKFRGRDAIALGGLDDLGKVLSAGTLVGLRIFSEAIRNLKTGGYLLIDDIESHLNHEIVSTLLGFYMDARINTNGASMLFTTHHPGFLDDFTRNDCIFITRNIGGISIENLSDILTRNDIKKSEAYESDFLEGTAPALDSYTHLRNHLLSHGILQPED